MKYINTIVIGLLLVILASCSGLKVQKVSEVKTQKANQLLYTLPKAGVQFQFTFTKHEYVPGPYAMYTQQFLEMEQPKTEAESWWELSKIEHSLLSTKDTSEAYVISGCLEKIKSENYTQLLNYQVNQAAPLFMPSSTNNVEKDLPFSELTMKKLIIEDSKTSYKTITVDSVTKRVPVVNTVLRNKTKEELAKDAAKSLTKIRKRKFRLMAGMNEKLPKSGALKQMLEELDKKEQAYLDLFMGKTISTEKVVYFQVDPEQVGIYPLLAWNSNSGPLPKPNKSDLMILNIQGEALANDSTEADLKIAKFLPLRSASNTPIYITHKGERIYSAVIQLPQLAPVQYLPLNFLKHKTIELDSKTGLLKKIQ